jgi:hypothetical protein
VATNGDYLPASQGIFGLPSHWTVYLKLEKDKSWLPATVSTIVYDPKFHALRLVLADLGGAVSGELRNVQWAVTVAGVNPNCNAGSPEITLQYPNPPNTLPNDNRFLRPVKASETATLSLTGSFAAGGGSKPVYAIKEIGNFGAPEKYRFHTLLPLFTSEIDINQSVKAGSEPAGYRSRVDPDAISVGGALWRVKRWNHGPVFDFTSHLQLADFEFSRKDPASSYVGGFGSVVVMKPLQNKNGSVVLNTDIYLGLEAGHNLKKPTALDGVPVDLSHYSTILRGVPGADVNFSVESADWTTVVFSVGAVYRVRLPAFDEPFITDYHRQKAVGLNTKARNWVDVTATYNPFHWRYFSFQTEYKYGSLPPIFSLVDHSVTVGINLSAIQTSLAKF